MGHQETYRHNEAYAEFLANVTNESPHFYAKYTDSLCAIRPGARILDVGCGVGQVIGNVVKRGFEAYGVDVSEPNVDRAKALCANCQVYDGRHLPFPDAHFASAGAFNVLEHVEEPETFIKELVRVVEANGRIVISSPNFFRVIGFRDYHPKMRGIKNKMSNWIRLRQKCRQIKASPNTVLFDHMPPIVKEPFSPDDDAIVATNALEIGFFLRQFGCEIDSSACTDRYVAKPVDFLLNFTPLRYLMFNAFVVARKVH
jgi:SAM-dependent methyltransferase